jgi:hypothetical protein
MNIFDWTLGFITPEPKEDTREDYKCGRQFEKVKHDVMDSLRDKGLRVNERELYAILDTLWEWRVVD